MQCGTIIPTASPTESPTTSTPTISPTQSPTLTGYTYPPTSSPTECHEQGLFECGDTVSGSVYDGCGNDILDDSEPDHMYVLNMSSPGVREFCTMFETIKVFRGDRTAPLTAATEVVPTTDESTGGCTNGFESYTFRLDAGLYNVVVVGGRKSKPLFFLCYR